MTIVETAGMRAHQLYRRLMTGALVASVVLGAPALMGAGMLTDALARREAQMWPQFMAYLALCGTVVWRYFAAGHAETIATIDAQKEN